MAFSFIRFFILTCIGVLTLCLLANNPARACYDAKSSHPVQTPPDAQLNTGGIDTADIVFIGIVIRDESSPSPTYRVVAPIKGAQPGDIFHAPSATDCDIHTAGELWFYEFTKPSSSYVDRLRVKVLTALGLSWTEDTGRINYGVYTEAKLRDACGNIVSPLKAAQLKEEYHIDIASTPRFDLPALLAKADKGDADAQDDLREYYECRNDNSNASTWGRKAEYQRSIAPARAGDPHAAAIVGWSYSEGIATGVPDNEAAVKWLQMAVPAGDPLALTTLAHLYLRGDGVARDPAQAVFLLTILMRQSLGFPAPLDVCPSTHPRHDRNEDEVHSCEAAAHTLSPQQLADIRAKLAAWEKAHCAIPNTPFPCRRH